MLKHASQRRLLAIRPGAGDSMAVVLAGLVLLKLT